MYVIHSMFMIDLFFIKEGDFALFTLCLHGTFWRHICVKGILHSAVKCYLCYEVIGAMTCHKYCGHLGYCVMFWCYGHFGFLSIVESYVLWIVSYIGHLQAFLVL